MCKVLDYREARGRASGIAEGIEQGMTQGITKGIVQGEAVTLVKLVDNYIRKTGATLIAACDILDVSVERYKEAKRFVIKM